MSTPMFDMPEHFPMPINAEGNGPAEAYEAIGTVCWCGVNGCTKFKEVNDD